MATSVIQVLWKQSGGHILIAAGAGILSGVAGAGLVAATNQLVASAPSWSFQALEMFVGLCLARLVTGLAAHLLLIGLSQQSVARTRRELCQRILQTPLGQLDNVGRARLRASLGEDIGQIANTVTNLPYLFVNLVILSACLIYLGYLSSVVLIGLGGCMALGAVSYWLPVLAAHRYLRRARTSQNALLGAYEALLGGTAELKLHSTRRAAFVQRSLLPAIEGVRRNTFFGTAIYSAAANWGRTLFFVYVGALVFVLPMWLPGEAPHLSAYIIVVLYMMAPLEAVMNAVPVLRQADVAAEAVESLGLSLLPEPEATRSSVVEQPSQAKQIAMRSVVYRYDDADTGFALGPVNLELKAGQITFLVGGNGSGKTTLARILVGLYVPCSGEVDVDGVVVTDSNRQGYRDLFSAVFSEPWLFDALYGIPSERIRQLAPQLLAQLGLQNKLLIDDGALFSTLALSHGQRKRVALLTALLEDRPVYVFDEWAADQDPSFRRWFYESVLPALRQRGKMVVVITHDDRYFHLADQVVHMEEGRIRLPTSMNTGHDDLVCAKPLRRQTNGQFHEQIEHEATKPASRCAVDGSTGQVRS